jgi:hypothetical protein
MMRDNCQTIIEAARSASFLWGEDDCFTFAGDVVQAITGADPFAEWRGKYNDPVTAYRCVRAAGFDSLDDAFASLWPRIAPGFAQLGDIGLAKSDDGMACLVYDGNGWIGRSPSYGTVRVRMADVHRAYKVAK